jgi:hypothetical protein
MNATAERCAYCPGEALEDSTICEQCAIERATLALAQWTEPNEEAKRGILWEIK